jgi:hypothetical protein
MARKAIPDATQANILLRSRRRCCLCFWLKGEDEVKKGQLAHLDGDNENVAVDNLVFLCLEHHDEYDSIPRLSKGLREQEVTKWRNELYKEMEYRFRTVRHHNCELTMVRLRRTIPDPQYGYSCVEFRLKNTGDAELRTPVVSIRLPDGYYAEPQWDPKDQTVRISLKEVKGDLFEPNGRIGIAAPIPILLRDHSVTFFGLSLHMPSRLQGTTVSLEYRIDAERMAPVAGVIQLRHPSEEKDLTPPHHP